MISIEIHILKWELVTKRIYFVFNIYHDLYKLKTIVLRYSKSMAEFSESEIRKIRENFDIFDFNRDGRISTVDLIPCFRSLNFVINAKDADKILVDFESNSCSFLEFDQFVMAIK